MGVDSISIDSEHNDFIKRQSGRIGMNVNPIFHHQTSTVVGTQIDAWSHEVSVLSLQPKRDERGFPQMR